MRVIHDFLFAILELPCQEEQALMPVQDIRKSNSHVAFRRYGSADLIQQRLRIPKML